MLKARVSWSDRSRAFAFSTLRIRIAEVVAPAYAWSL